MLILFDNFILMEKFEKDRSYYENLYERRIIRNQKFYHEKFKKTNDENEKRALNLLWYFTKMNDYKNREETIEKWILKDRKKDELLKNAMPPHNIIRCKICNLIMELEDKEFCDWYDWKADRVLFIYRCNACRKWRAFYNTWEEFESKNEYCNKCWDIINYTAKFDWDILIKNYKCDTCWNNYISKEDFSSSYMEEDPITEKDVKMYWYNEKEAKEMIEAEILINNLKTIMNGIDERKEEENYLKEISKLDKYNLYQLEELINKILEETEFINFKIINKEPVKTYIKCEFEVYFKWNFWENTSKIFDKLIEKLLENSNWKLQKNKTHEKLWVLNWVLFWYDNDKDLIELIKKNM